MEKIQKKCLVILSGGQDSVTCLYLALSLYDQVEAITFTYGQNHKVELECAKNVCEKENVPHKVVELDFFRNIVKSALIGNSDSDVNEIQSNGLPASFVPNRNALFLTLAHAYAQTCKADILMTGVCQTDYSGYPDCRASFVEAIIIALNLGSGVKIEVDYPLMYLNKAETFQLANELGKLKEVIELSHTCYRGDRTNLHEWGYGCNDCPACELRKKGYLEFATMEQK